MEVHRYRMAIDLHKKGELKIPSLTKAAMGDEEIRRHGKEAPDYARKLAEELMKRTGTEIERLETMIDEYAYLSSVLGFLGTESIPRYRCSRRTIRRRKTR